MEKATFAGGCFWCIEAALKHVEGVEKVVSGYTGGEEANPTYREVCSGSTGHAEAVEVEFDPCTVSYRDLLEVFFSVHNPTTLNREGPDVGSQYRSAVYYHDEEQKEVVDSYVEELSRETGDEIVTEIEPAGRFYEAEEHHQDYFEKNPDSGYCRVNVKPKIQKVDEMDL
ncbi:MAG: peptide-methionine (S)-S-oxide reductase MsrA [Halobacteria archaeon]